MTQHTPAPWHIEINKDNQPWDIMIKGEPSNGLSKHIADINPNCNPFTHGYDAMDNARLIASAPELLEVLEQLHATLMFNPVLKKDNSINLSLLKASQTINKAKGN